ncbi:MAG: LppX_LprAFG lipoprotein [Chloroflexota bacterium]
MLRLPLLIALVACFAAGCSGASSAPPPDPLELVTTAAENIRQTDSFRMLVERTGAPYYIETDLGRVAFRRAEAQYVAPNTMQANVRLIAGGLPTEVGVFSRGDNQWYRNDILTLGRWFNAPFSPGFNPETLIASEAGFQASLQALIDLEYVGETTLEDGSPVYHLTATASGPDVTALLAGLVDMPGMVDVDVYIHRERIIPVRFVIVQPETVSEEEPEPTQWTIDIYDVNAPAEIDDPEATAEPDA